ncbi:hypothetical protein MUK42_02994 [Musa troglodytarum]|uniref:Uncharacterized protein n=1 Tax=Musa troglodytarum TaxID=320322 RepID=A0A9E7I5N6_9LILI|nr:hypothetical protein MUK42_36045 [Musa troglodytarum]URE42414.1 hypothetical protein MUK42_02994 [Musa troglodytarum]
MLQRPASGSYVFDQQADTNRKTLIHPRCGTHVFQPITILVSVSACSAMHRTTLVPRRTNLL